MKNQLACQMCDLLMEVEELEERLSYHCPRCQHLVTKWRPNTPMRVVAISLVSLLSLSIVFLFPFMTLTASGISNTMSLVGTTALLAEIGYQQLALIVLLGLFILPCFILLSALVIHLSLLTKRHLPGSKLMAKWLFIMVPWSMIEVFLAGVLVSMIKILGLAALTFNSGFWAYMLFNILFVILITHLDQYRVWHGLDVI